MEQNGLQQQYAEQQAKEQQMYEVQQANLWGSIPMKKKAQIIKEAVASGITDLEQIRQLYTQTMLAQQNVVRPQTNYSEEQLQQLGQQPIEQSEGQVQQQGNQFAKGGRVNKFDGSGRSRMQLGNPADYAGMSQSSTYVQPVQLPAEKIQITAEMKAQQAAAEKARQEALARSNQGTLREITDEEGHFSNFGSDMDAYERNRILQNPKGLKERIQRGLMREEIQYRNGNSVVNGLETVGKVVAAGAMGAGMGAVGAAGKTGQVVKAGYDAYKTAGAVKGAVDAYQSGDYWGAAANALGVVGKTPVGSTISTAAKTTSTAMKTVKAKGGLLNKYSVKI